MFNLQQEVHSNLPAKFKQGAPLNEPIPETFYASGPEGYTDYPTL